MTSNLQHRLFQHNSGLVKSTKNRTPLDLIYYETFDDKTDVLEMNCFKINRISEF